MLPVIEVSIFSGILSLVSGAAYLSPLYTNDTTRRRLPIQDNMDSFDLEVLPKVAREHLETCRELQKRLGHASSEYLYDDESYSNHLRTIRSAKKIDNLLVTPKAMAVALRLLNRYTQEHDIPKLRKYTEEAIVELNEMVNRTVDRARVLRLRLSVVEDNDWDVDLCQLANACINRICEREEKEKEAKQRKRIEENHVNVSTSNSPVGVRICCVQFRHQETQSVIIYCEVNITTIISHSKGANFF